MRRVCYEKLFLVCHDVEHHAVGFVHALAAYACHIVDGAVNILLNESFDAGDMLVLDGEHGRKNSGGHSAGYLQGA